MEQKSDFAGLRDRAYALADTGRFPDWESLCSALERESGNPKLVRQLNADAMFKLLIRNRIRKSAERGR